MRWILIPPLLICSIYLVLLIALFLIQDDLIFGTDARPLEYVPKINGLEEWSYVRSDGGQAVAWFIPVESTTIQARNPCVVHFHGNGQIIDFQAALIERYHDFGFSVLLPEYPGFGRSEGKPSQASILRDCRYFIEKLKNDTRVDLDRIVLHGQSLGGGVAVQVTKDLDVAAIILESTFTSLASMASRYYAPEFLVKHPFRSDRIIGSLTCPILLFHGTEDRLIDIEHARMLKTLATKSAKVELVEYRCGHGDLPGKMNQEDYWKRIATFLEPLRGH